MAFPRGGSSSTVSRSNWNLEVLVFDERGKPEYPEKNLSEQSREPTTNSIRESDPGRIGGRRALLPLLPINHWLLKELRQGILSYFGYIQNYL